MQKFSLLFLSIAALVLMAFISEQQNNQHSTGAYTISLAVKDITASVDFYEKLGFKPVEDMGGITQKWVILSNGETTIGLFQDLFPENTLTFNPMDGRSIYKHLTEQGITPAFESGMDASSGPCSFTIVDPDGNPILFDQH